MLTMETLSLFKEDNLPEVSKVSLRDITPDNHNANMGTERGKSALDSSLQRYGAGRSILLDKHNRIIAGNQTFASAGELGFENVVVVESDGKSLVAVKRTDLDLDDKDGREMAYADNRVGSLNLKFDPEVLKEDFESGEIDLSPFFTAEEIETFTEQEEPTWVDEPEKLVAPENHLRLRIDCQSVEEKEELALRLESEGFAVKR